MYQNQICKIKLIAQFRKEAKKLVKAHAEDIELNYPDKSTRQQQHQDKILMHRVFFNAELTALFTETLQKANHLSDIFKMALEKELTRTFAKYQDFYKARY